MVLENYIGPHGFYFLCIKITEENINKISDWCFGVIITSPSLCIKFWGFGDDEEPSGRAFIGDWIVQGPDDYFESFDDEQFTKNYSK